MRRYQTKSGCFEYLSRLFTHSFSLLFFFLFVISTGEAQQTELTRIVEQQIQKDNPSFVEIFKHLHQNPELGFMETETSAFIADKLRSYGYEVKTGIGKTGLAGIIRNGGGPIVMYRAELDALPVHEITGVPYASTKIVKQDDGTESYVMHACGHDAHMTWMLSAAKFMAEHKNLWKGTLILVGQPAEEIILGAEAMVKDGLYTKYGIPEPDYLYGMHSLPFATGTIVTASGIRTAGSDQLDVTFKGIGGHGSAPELAKDPVMMAVNAVTLYQQVVSRNSNPRHPVVLTVGSIQAGSANNVIPAESLVKLNLRWFSDEDRKVLLDGIERVNQSIAVANGIGDSLSPTTVMKGWCVPMDNDEGLTRAVQQGLKDKMPGVNLLTEKDVPPIMGSEDFQHLVIHNQKKVYFYANIGVADPAVYEKSMAENGIPPFYNHNGNYDVDLNAIPIGTRAATYGLLTIFDRYRM